MSRLVRRDTVISCIFTVTYISCHTGHWYHMYMYHRCTDTMTRYTSSSYSCSPLHRIPSFHILWSSLHGFSAYHCYTCMYGISILVIWVPVPITCIIVPCYPCSPVIWLIDSRYWMHELLICDVCNPTSIVPFPVILFYAINRAQVQLSCYLYHVLYVFLLHCISRS